MTAPDWSRLPRTLLDFERSPGRFRVVLREPRPLFEHIASVMLLAIGRPVDGWPASASAPELRRAARFFVRTVMLRPGSDPFTLLGLTPDFEPAQLREHYRLMIRLTHPDFATAGERWPLDSATRVNLANDLLSSPEKRAGYAAAPHRRALVAPPTLPGTPMQHPGRRASRPAAASDKARGGRWSPRAKLALAGTGALLMVSTLLAISAIASEGSLTTVRRVSPVQDSASLDGRPKSTQVAPGTPDREVLRP